MGLLNAMTVKYKVDLSDLKSGNQEARSLLSSMREVIDGVSASLRSMSTAFNAGELVDQVSSASTQIATLAEDAAMTGESLLSVGTDAGEMGSEVAAGADEAASSLSGVRDKAESTSGSLSGLI